jgi:hypothetical protein
LPPQHFLLPTEPPNIERLFGLNQGTFLTRTRYCIHQFKIMWLVCKIPTLHHMVTWICANQLRSPCIHRVCMVKWRLCNHNRCLSCDHLSQSHHRHGHLDHLGRTGQFQSTNTLCHINICHHLHMLFSRRVDNLLSMICYNHIYHSQHIKHLICPC